jgi:hypothetical protein
MARKRHTGEDCLRGAVKANALSPIPAPRLPYFPNLNPAIPPYLGSIPMLPSHDNYDSLTVNWEG